MNRIHVLAGALFATLLLIFAVALAQPPLDSLVVGTPTDFGFAIIDLAELLSTAALAYLSTHLLKKIRGVNEWVTMMLGTLFALGFAWALNYGAVHFLHLQTGISVPAKGAFGFLLAAVSFKLRKVQLARRAKTLATG